jgi:4'-phosphopantetheinyl transferase
VTLTAFGRPYRQVQPEYGEAHVWCASLDDAAYPKEEYEELLTDKECDRAARFLRKRDGDRYILGLGILKTLIMDYMGVGPDRLQFSYGPYGKPILDAGLGADRLCFNMAESEGYALFAFAKGTEIGIDIEQIREIPEMDQIVGLFFSEAEQAAFASLLPQEKKRAFFDGWTRKEAFIKAFGVGLFMPLNKFAISLTPGNPVSLLYLDKGLVSLGQWTVRDVSTLPGFSAALAVKGSQCTILSRDFVAGMLG